MATKNENEQLRTSTAKKAMIEALSKSLGVVSTAAKKVGIDPETHRLWTKSDPVYAQQVAEIKEAKVDFLESMAHKRVMEGSDTMIIFLLKTQGRDRGYIERQDVNVTNSGALSDDEKQELEKLRAEQLEDAD